MNFFHDAFAASSREQICGRKFRVKMVPGHVCGVFRYEYFIFLSEFFYKLYRFSPENKINQLAYLPLTLANKTRVLSTK